MLVKVLGSIDLVASVIFLMAIFGFDTNIKIVLFCAGLLLLKSLFILGGDVLSAIDLFSSVILVLSIFFALPAFLLWIPSFFLLAKGFVSFL